MPKQNKFLILHSTKRIMKTINRKNYRQAPKVLYKVIINMGGLAHKKIYKCDQCEEGNIWVSKNGEEDIRLRVNQYDYGCKSIPLNKVIKKDGYWNFISDSEETAQTFALGAHSVLAFMNDMWFCHYGTT